MENSIQERKRKLYGSDRNKEIQRVAETLRKSSVLKEGEYNYTTEKLGDDVWQSATSVDFKVRLVFFNKMHKQYMKSVLFQFH